MVSIGVLIRSVYRRRIMPAPVAMDKSELCRARLTRHSWCVRRTLRFLYGLSQTGSLSLGGTGGTPVPPKTFFKDGGPGGPPYHQIFLLGRLPPPPPTAFFRSSSGRVMVMV